MISLDKAELRTFISVADADDLSRLLSSDRSVLAREDVEDQFSQGPLVLDGLRRRPRYFDGRFLTGADLTRDQDYVRQRQADMARAGGSGVISGLRVRNVTLSAGQSLSISPGVGLTPSGDVVMLSQRRDVPLLDLPTSRQLDAALGLAEEPRVPLGRRTGLYILALRPVEFTANPIAAYPRSIAGQRSIEDGDIIEASAITLIPYPDMNGAANVMEARRKVAKTIFNGRGAAMPQDALPLAMLALDRGMVRWIDTAMVRRETGSESGVHAMFGTRPRAIAEAFLLQHHRHLIDTMVDLASRGMGATLPASAMFSLLPPVGAMPASTLSSDDLGFTQRYFPPGVDADIAFVPSDEIAALAEEALSLPPIDLDAPPDMLDAVGVTIMVPVDRVRYQRLNATLGSLSQPVAGSAASGSSASGFDLVSAIVERRKLMEAEARDATAVAAVEAERLRIASWRSALTEAVGAITPAVGGEKLVWFMRRRSIAQQPAVTGRGVGMRGDDVALNAAALANVERLRLSRRLASINGEATPQATVGVLRLLAVPQVAESDTLTVAVLSDLEKVIAAALPPPVLPRGIEEMLDAVDLSSLSDRIRIDPGMLSGPASTGRAGMDRVAIADALGTSTAARKDTPLKLGEREVADIAEDYADKQLGEGLARLIKAARDGWKEKQFSVWLGDSGMALAVDEAFRRVGEEHLADFTTLTLAALTSQKPDDLKLALKRMA